jgi:hypothetical protein
LGQFFATNSFGNFYPESDTRKLTLEGMRAPTKVGLRTASFSFSLTPEMVRKGRFDEIFFVDLPPGKKLRLTLLPQAPETSTPRQRAKGDQYRPP